MHTNTFEQNKTTEQQGADIESRAPVTIQQNKQLDTKRKSSTKYGEGDSFLENISRVFATSVPYNLNINICADFHTENLDDFPLILNSVTVKVFPNEESHYIDVLPRILPVMDAAFPIATLVKSEEKDGALKLTYSFDIEDWEYYNSIDDLLKNEIHAHHEKISQFIIENHVVKDFQMTVNIGSL